MAFTPQEVDAWFKANPTATPQLVADTIKNAGGLSNNAGLADLLATRYGTDAGTITSNYNQLTTPTAGLPAAPVTTPAAAPVGGLNQASTTNVGQVKAPTTGALQQVAAPTSAPPPPPVPSDAEIGVLKWTRENPNGTPKQMAAAIAAAGGMNPELAKVLAVKFNMTPEAVTSNYTKLAAENATEAAAAAAAAAADAKYQTNLTAQTDPMKSGLTKLLTDNNISLEEANQIKSYYDIYQFKPEDIARVTGRPISQINEVLGARNTIINQEITKNINNPIALVQLAQDYNLTAKDFASESGGKFTEQQAQSVLDKYKPLMKEAGNIKNSISSLLSDKSISQSEANAITQYMDKTGFTPADFSYVTGVPIETINQLIGAKATIAGQIISTNKTNPVGLAEYAIANGLNAKQMAAASNGLFTEQQAQSALDIVNKVGKEAGNIRDSISYVLADSKISLEEANNIRAYYDKNKFSPEDIAFISGKPIELINQLLGAQSAIQKDTLKQGYTANANNPLGLVEFAKSNKLTPKDLASASGGALTEDAARALMDKAGTYAGRIELQSPEAYDVIKGLAQKTADEFYGGQIQDWQVQLFTPIDTATIGLPKQLQFDPVIMRDSINDDGILVQVPVGGNTVITPNVVAIGGGSTDGGDIPITGYRSTQPVMINGVPVHANYDVNGKLTGYDGDGMATWLNDKDHLFAHWTADGSAKPMPARSEGFIKGIGNSVAGLLRDFGPVWTAAKIVNPALALVDVGADVLRGEVGLNTAINAATAYAGIQNAEAASLLNPSSVNYLSAGDLANEIARTGINPITAAQTNAAIASTAAAAIPAIDAVQKGNYTQLGAVAAGAISNPLLAGQFDFKTNPTVANAMYGLSGLSAYENKDLAGLLSSASGLAKSSDLALAAAATRFIDAAASGDENKILLTGTALGNELSTNQRTSTYIKDAEDYLKGLVPKEVKDTVIAVTGVTDDVKTLIGDTKADIKSAIDNLKTSTTAAAKVFQDSIRAGATEEEAYNAAKLSEGKIIWDPNTGKTLTPSGPDTKASTTPTTPVVKTEVATTTNPSVVDTDNGNLKGAIDTATARNTVVLKNDEANSLEEAVALAKVRNPNATQFTIGGNTYKLGASNETVNAIATKNNIANAETFDDAYQAARFAYGPNKTFTWNGKEYSTATAAERPDLTGKVTTPTVVEKTTQGTTDTSQPAGQGTTLKPLEQTSFFGQLLKDVNNQFKLSSDAANDYLRNNPKSPITKNVSTAFEAAGNLQKNVVGGTALLLNNKPLSDALVKSGGNLAKIGQSLGDGVVDTKNWNDTISLVEKADGFEKVAVLAGRFLDGTSGLARQFEVELRQEFPALFLGGGTVRGIFAASTAIDTLDAAGNAALDTYDQDIKKGKNHTESLSNARKAGVAAGGTELAIQLTLGKIADVALGNIANVAGKVGTKVAGETVVEGVQSGGSSAAVDVALGNPVNVNNVLTQGVLGGAVGKGTAAATTPVDVAQAVTTGSPAGTVANTGTTLKTDLGTVGSAVPSTQVGAGTTILDTKADTNISNISNNVTTQIGSGADASSVVGNTVTTAINSGSNAPSVVGPTVTAAVTAGGNVSTVVGSAVTAATAAGANVDTTVASSVSSAIAAGANPTTVVTAAANAAIAAGNSVTVTSNPTSTTINNATTNTTTNVNNSTGVTTTVDKNTNVTTTIDTKNNTTTTFNANTNATTQTNNNTGVTTNAATNTAVDTNANANTNTNINTNINTNVPPPVVPPVVPAAAAPVVTATATPPAEDEEDKKKKALAAAGSSIAGKPFTPPEGYIPAALKEQFLKTSGTQEAFKNPLQDLFKIYASGAAAKGMSNMEPQIAAMLSQQMGIPQESGVDQMGGSQIPQGQLGAPLSQNTGTPYSESSGYFTYGQEDDIDELLGRPKRPVADPAGLKMADGGYVQPLTLAYGGMATPLMAATGGLPTKGREDFRTSKHVAGKGDGHSDDIPAMLADGEFVFSADVVSALGNGSTKAGSDKLYKMVEEIRKRARSTSPDKLAPPALKSPLDYLKKR